MDQIRLVCNVYKNGWNWSKHFHYIQYKTISLSNHFSKSFSSSECIVRTLRQFQKRLALLKQQRLVAMLNRLLTLKQSASSSQEATYYQAMSSCTRLNTASLLVYMALLEPFWKQVKFEGEKFFFERKSKNFYIF